MQKCWMFKDHQYRTSTTAFIPFISNFIVWTKCTHQKTTRNEQRPNCIETEIKLPFIIHTKTQKRNWNKCHCYYWAANASLFLTQFVISYTLKQRIPITAYQFSFGRAFILFFHSYGTKSWNKPTKTMTILVVVALFMAYYFTFRNNLWLLVIFQLNRQKCDAQSERAGSHRYHHHHRNVFNPGAWITSFGNYHWKLFFCHFLLWAII